MQSQSNDQDTEDEDAGGCSAHAHEGIPPPDQPTTTAGSAPPMPPPPLSMGGLRLQKQQQQISPLLPTTAAVGGRTQLTRMLQPKKQVLKRISSGPAPATGTAAAAAGGRPSRLGPSRLGMPPVEAHCPPGPSPPGASPAALPAAAGLMSPPVPQSSGSIHFHQSGGSLCSHQQQHSLDPHGGGSAQRPFAPLSSGSLCQPKDTSAQHQLYRCEMSVQRPPLSAATKNLGTARTPCMPAGSAGGSGQHAAVATSAVTTAAGTAPLRLPLSMLGTAPNAAFGGHTSSVRGASLFPPTGSLLFGYTPTPAASAPSSGGGGRAGSSKDGHGRICAASHSILQSMAPGTEVSADGHSTQGQLAPSQRGNFGYGSFPVSTSQQLAAAPRPFFCSPSPSPSLGGHHDPRPHHSHPSGNDPAAVVMGLPGPQPVFCPLAWPPGPSSGPSAASLRQQPMAVVDTLLGGCGGGSMSLEGAMSLTHWLNQALTPMQQGLEGLAVPLQQQPYVVSGSDDGSGGEAPPVGRRQVSPISQLLLLQGEGGEVMWD